MYAIESLKHTKLMKHMGEVPVFYDGKVTSIHCEDTQITLELILQATHNPALGQDTCIIVVCHGVKTFHIQKKVPESGLLTIHDFDVKRLDDGLLLRMETIDHAMQEIYFTTIEMHKKTV